jgi:hypothetical protein
MLLLSTGVEGRERESVSLLLAPETRLLTLPEGLEMSSGSKWSAENCLRRPKAAPWAYE